MGGTLSTPSPPVFHWPLLNVIPLCCFALSSLLNFIVPGPQHRKNFNFQDKTVLITGASTGLGRCLAVDLYKKGAKLILTARSINKLEELCDELLKSGEGRHDPVYRYLDLADIEGLHSVVDLPSLSIDGRTIDVLINNAGLSMRGSVKDTPVSVHRTLFEVNYFGHVHMTRELLDNIPSDGMIITISSMQGRLPLPYRSAYSASKHALQAFFDCLRCENRPDLHIMVVSAGYMNTGFGKKALDSKGEAVGVEDKDQAKGISGEAAAAAIIHAAEARQLELFLAPAHHRLAIFLRWLWPSLYFYIMYRRGCKEEWAKKKEH